jgi:hypothetical protein
MPYLLQANAVIVLPPRTIVVLALDLARAGLPEIDADDQTKYEQNAADDSENNKKNETTVVIHQTSHQKEVGADDYPAAGARGLSRFHVPDGV